MFIFLLSQRECWPICLKQRYWTTVVEELLMVSPKGHLWRLMQVHIWVLSTWAFGNGYRNLRGKNPLNRKNRSGYFHWIFAYRIKRDFCIMYDTFVFELQALLKWLFSYSISLRIRTDGFSKYIFLTDILQEQW